MFFLHLLISFLTLTPQKNLISVFHNKKAACGGFFAYQHIEFTVL